MCSRGGEGRSDEKGGRRQVMKIFERKKEHKSLTIVNACVIMTLEVFL